MDLAVLDTLCPMHVIVGTDGVVRRAGPTILKLRPAAQIVGRPLLDVFDLRHPRDATSFNDLAARPKRRLQLRFRDAPNTAFKAVLAPPFDDGRHVLSLSFGLSVESALQEYGLSATDFAITDPTLEMHYLLEAKTAALAASRRLSRRLHRAKCVAEKQAFTDVLTGVKSRHAMNSIMTRTLKNGTAFTLVHIDLDHFKTINDSHGHPAGDYVLQQAARAIVDVTRADDAIGRVGGDEFVAILHGQLPRKTQEAIAARIIERIEEPISFGAFNCRISASIGVLPSSVYNQIPIQDRLEKDADLALYASKRRGRGCYTFFDMSMRTDPAHGEGSTGFSSMRKSLGQATD